MIGFGIHCGGYVKTWSSVLNEVLTIQIKGISMSTAPVISTMCMTPERRDDRTSLPGLALRARRPGPAVDVVDAGDCSCVEVAIVCVSPRQTPSGGGNTTG